MEETSKKPQGNDFIADVMSSADMWWSCSGITHNVKK